MRKKAQIISCNKTEMLWIAVKGLILLFLMGMLFYDSVFAAIIGSPCLYVYWRREYQKLRKKKAEKLAEHFKELLLSVVSALKAGYSAENAFVEAYKDLYYRFGEKDAMVQKLSYINRQVHNHIPLERLLEEFAMETGLEDIMDFAATFQIGKRSGGDMAGIMEHTVSIMTKRMEMKEEIRMVVAAKQYEQQIMNLVPMGIILYIRMTNTGYFDSLYHNTAGIAIMTAALAIYIGAYFLSEKILDIA